MKRSRGPSPSRLRLVRYVEGVDRYLRAEFVCECGTTCVKRVDAVVDGAVKSCGCLNQQLKLRNTNNMKHGHARHGAASPEYWIWQAMLSRCTRTTDKAWQNYGGRGITVCARWKSFAAFLEDVGARPAPHLSIDRIDNNGNYEPGNVRWATRREQALNRRQPKTAQTLTHMGRTQTVRDWSRELGLKIETIRHRLRHGWSVADTLDTAVRLRATGEQT